jgi:hypothetical protein
MMITAINEYNLGGSPGKGPGRRQTGKAGPDNGNSGKVATVLFYGICHQFHPMGNGNFSKIQLADYEVFS